MYLSLVISENSLFLVKNQQIVDISLFYGLKVAIFCTYWIFAHSHLNLLQFLVLNIVKDTIGDIGFELYYPDMNIC